MTKVKVYTQFDRPKTIPSNPGDHYLNEYQESFNKKGEDDLILTGKKDVYAMIQTDLEDTKIENILHKVAMGDMSVLNQREAVYVDATEMPKTLMEAQNLIIKAQNEFLSFPKEVRDLFENSPEKYVEEMGTPEFLEKMSPYNKKLKAIKEAGDLATYNAKVAEAAKFERDVEAAKGVTNEQKQ